MTGTEVLYLMCIGGLVLCGITVHAAAKKHKIGTLAVALLGMVVLSILLWILTWGSGGM